MVEEQLIKWEMGEEGLEMILISYPSATVIGERGVQALRHVVVPTRPRLRWLL